MKLEDYVYTNHNGDIVIDNNGFCKDLINLLMCCNIFGKDHIELVKKILLNKYKEKDKLTSRNKDIYVEVVDKLEEKENYIKLIKKSLNEIDKDMEFEYLITQNDSITGFTFFSPKPYTLCVAHVEAGMDIKKAIYDALKGYKDFNSFIEK